MWPSRPLTCAVTPVALGRRAKQMAPKCATREMRSQTPRQSLQISPKSAGSRPI
jgi:hypothetical protein